jgi:glycosyltransferase-like protein
VPGAAVGLVTYSTKPRGGVVHLLALAEALAARAWPVEIIALGEPEAGFFRPVTVPCTFVPPPVPAPDLEGRVFAAIEALEAGLAARAGSLPPVLHVQDCIAARAAVRRRDAGEPLQVVRTVHHVDDFTTPALVECQLRSILDPDRVLVVSRTWRRRLHNEYGVDADVVSNGVDVGRFHDAPASAVVAALRARAGAIGRPLLLTVGGIEPRKGTDHLFRALSLLRRRWDPPPVLAVVGGHSFQDHTPYRERVIAAMPGLDLAFGRDVVQVGTVPDQELPGWYHAADAFVFPSVTEGFGLAVIEAMAAGLPVVLTDLPVFAEYLRFGRDALAVAPGDDVALAAAIETAVRDEAVRAGLIACGRRVAARFSWDETARQHEAIYRSVRGAPDTITRSGLPGAAGS